MIVERALHHATIQCMQVDQLLHQRIACICRICTGWCFLIRASLFRVGRSCFALIDNGRAGTADMRTEESRDRNQIILRILVDCGLSRRDGVLGLFRLRRRSTRLIPRVEAK